MTNFRAKRFRLNLINLKRGSIGRIWQSYRWRRQPEVVKIIENRSETETKPNNRFVTIITRPPPYNGKTPILDPRSSVTPDVIDLKFGTCDYFVGTTQHAKT